jgi:hypothetical protein
VTLSREAVDAVFADAPAVGFELWRRLPGERMWVKIFTHRTRLACVRQMRGSGDYQISEVFAVPGVPPDRGAEPK